MPPKAWCFIPTNGSSKDEVNQRIVRQTAMREYRRSERLARARKYAEMQAEKGQRHAGTSERLESDRRNREVFTPEPFAPSHEIFLAIGRGFGSIDPFGSTVLPHRKDASILFSHFVSEIAPKLQPAVSKMNNNIINSIFARTALADPGLLATILFHAGVHSDSLYGRPWSQSTLHYRGETIRILNDRLQSSEEAISDSSVAMVGFLAASGNITGDVAADQLHTIALKRMISLRGGLSSLGWEGALAMLISVSVSFIERLLPWLTDSQWRSYQCNDPRLSAPVGGS
ncbi:hypothetical protein IQ07DRAFT_645272 [Pyrenochaeta sp. DS3sAY3a]|nr:hypothetical protein IQ07DRAFT_645272 [Pyrenochaeta sp. DS3sAY3a]